MSNIRRLQLTHLIGQKLNHRYNRFHIRSVVNLLIEELIVELMNGNEIGIENFGTFSLRKIKPRKIREVNSGKLKVASRTKALRFRMSEKLSKFLSKKIFDEMLKGK